MAKEAIWIFVALCFVCSYQQPAMCANIFDQILDDVEPCKEACDKTYPLHTYPNPKHSECCKRGCRFYSLVEFINNRPNVNATRDACMASCMEAYSQTADRYACNIGCSSQVPYALSKMNATALTSASTTGTTSSPQDKAGNVQTLHLLTPFMYVHNIYNNMVDHMSRIMSVSWSFYLQQDDGKVVVVQSEPEIITEYLDMDDGEDSASLDSSDDSMTDDAGLPLSLDPKEPGQLARAPALASDSLPDIYMYHRQQQVGASSAGGATGRGDDSMPVRITVSAYSTEEIQSVDWLGCVSRKSGLPRWLLGLIIFFSAMVMVWLCFATTVTAPDHHIRPQILSIYGDLDSMKCVQEKVKIQPSYSPLIDLEAQAQQAGPLPTKVSLDQA